MAAATTASREAVEPTLGQVVLYHASSADDAAERTAFPLSSHMEQRCVRDDAARTSLGELALLFSRLGATAFGGPAAHIALMQAEVVSRRHWLSEERFLDLLGATNLIPGPNSTELALHIGWERRRLPRSSIIPGAGTTGRTSSGSAAPARSAAS